MIRSATHLIDESIKPRERRLSFMERVIFATALISASMLFSLSGCGGKTSKKPTAGETTNGTAHAHEHATQGPHGGSLIELGEEEYHAELVHDDAKGTVTVYILDSGAKASVPIDSTAITINLKHEGRGEQFNLAASPDAGDPMGKASRFVSSQAELAKDLDDEHADAQLAVSINGKPYRGKIEHHHEHEAK
jgi:hypothetical protein